MARARLTYTQRLGRDRVASPTDWSSIAEARTRVYRIDFSAPTSGRAGVGYVLALNAVHAMAVLGRRLEAIDLPLNVEDVCLDATITRQPKDTAWSVAEETEAERIARHQEMARLWMGAVPA